MHNIILYIFLSAYFLNFTGIPKWPLLIIQRVKICIQADIPCQTTFFPQTTTCATWFEPSVFTQASVFSAFDTLEHVSSTVSSARGSLHYFRGVYSTGVLSDWPSLWRGEFVSCGFLSCGDVDTPLGAWLFQLCVSPWGKAVIRDVT